jgi:hypothetical protein
MFSNVVICYYVELLATRPTNKLEDTPYRMSATAYSVYYQLPSISGDHLLHRNLGFRPHRDDKETLSTADDTLQLSWQFLWSSYIFNSINSITEEMHSCTQYYVYYKRLNVMVYFRLITVSDFIIDLFLTFSL